MQVARYDKADAEAWDALVDSSSSTTFQHSRRFLDYHGERFRDASLTFRDNGRLIAVWPAAAGGQGEVVSHPGAVHGGLVASDKLVRAGRVEEVVVASRAVVLVGYEDHGKAGMLAEESCVLR